MILEVDKADPLSVRVALENFFSSDEGLGMQKCSQKRSRLRKLLVAGGL
jgi:hypothetical protein